MQLIIIIIFICYLIVLNCNRVIIYWLEVRCCLGEAVQYEVVSGHGGLVVYLGLYCRGSGDAGQYSYTDSDLDILMLKR